MDIRTDWADDLPETLAMEFRKTAQQALVRAVAKECQDFETEFFKMVEDRWLGDALGSQLDKLGKLLVEPRGIRNDEEYRLALRVVIRARRSHGRTSDLEAVLELMGIAQYRYEEGPPASFRVEVYGPVAYEAMKWIFFIRPMGVAGEVVVSTAVAESRHHLESTYGPLPNPIAANVWGSAHAPGLGLGLPMTHARRV